MVDLRSQPGPLPRERATPQQPTTDESSVEALSGIGNIFKTAGDFFVAGAEAKAEGRESFEENKVVGQFVSEFETQVIEQGAVGDMDTNEMLARGRALTRKWIANNPEQSKNILAARSRVLTDHGLKGESFALSPEEKADEEDREEAQRLGIPVEELRAMKLQNALNKATQAELNIEETGLDIETKELNIAKKRRERKKKQAESVVTNTLNRAANLALDTMNTQVGVLKNMVDGKQINREQAVAELDSMYQNFSRSLSSQAVGQNVTGVDPSTDINLNDKLNVLKEPIDKSYEVYRRVLTGETSSEVATNELNTIENRTAVAFYEGLTVREKIIFFGASKLNIDNFTLQTELNTMGAKLIIDNADAANAEREDVVDGDDVEGDNAPPANVVGSNKKVRKQYLDEFLISNMREALKTGDQEHTDQVTDQLRGTLSSLSLYENVNDKRFKRPEDRVRAYRDVAKAIGSKEFFDFISHSDVRVTQEELDAASNTVRVQLVDRVIPEVRSEWREATRPRGTLTTGEERVSDEIEPFFDGNSFRFRVKEGAVLPNRALVKELNENVSGIMNTIIRATAHLENHDNYERVWNQQFSQIFDLGEEDADQ